MLNFPNEKEETFLNLYKIISMIQSMTGFEKAEHNVKNTNFTIEVKSLNSKHIDVNVKMPSLQR